MRLCLWHPSWWPMCARQVLDLHALATEKLLEDKALMNEVFKRCGEAEFRFIEVSGWVSREWFLVNEFVVATSVLGKAKDWYVTFI